MKCKPFVRLTENITWSLQFEVKRVNYPGNLWSSIYTLLVLQIGVRLPHCHSWAKRTESSVTEEDKLRPLVTQWAVPIKIEFPKETKRVRTYCVDVSKLKKVVCSGAHCQWTSLGGPASVFCTPSNRLFLIVLLIHVLLVIQCLFFYYSTSIFYKLTKISLGTRLATFVPSPSCPQWCPRRQIRMKP